MWNLTGVGVGVERTWGGETRNEKEKDKEKNIHNIVDKGEKPLKKIQMHKYRS